MTGTLLSLPGRPCIVALVPDREGQARITDALRDRADVVMVESVAAWEREIRARAAMVRALIATAHDAEGRAVASCIGRCRAFVPTAALIGYFRNGYSEEQALLAFARAGMNAMAFRNVTDTRMTLGTVIARGLHASVAEAVMGVVRPRVHARAERYVAYGVAHAYEQTGVEEFAAAFGRHRKTINTHLYEVDLPAPAALLHWCRFFVLGYLLDHGRAPVEELGLMLDFPSPSALRTQLKRYTGRRALELRATGALESIVDAFLSPAAVGREQRSLRVAPRPASTRFRPLRGGRWPGSLGAEPEPFRNGDAEEGEAVG